MPGSASAYERVYSDYNTRSYTVAVIPGVRVIYQNTKPRNLSDLAAGSSVLTDMQLETPYGSGNSDTEVLPSLTFQYDLTPALTTYLQYKHHVEWGLKGVTVNTSLFYNRYKNFIAYTRYARAGNPDKFVNVPGNIYTICQAENRDKTYFYGAELATRINFGSGSQPADGPSASFALGYNQGKSKSSYSGDKYVDLDSGAALADAAGEYMRVPGYGMVDATVY